MEIFLLISPKYVEVVDYENLPMQYTEIFFCCKNEKFIRQILIFFLFLFKT